MQVNLLEGNTTNLKAAPFGRKPMWASAFFSHTFLARVRIQRSAVTEGLEHVFHCRKSKEQRGLIQHFGEG